MHFFKKHRNLWRISASMRSMGLFACENPFVIPAIVLRRHDTSTKRGSNEIIHNCPQMDRNHIPDNPRTIAHRDCTRSGGRCNGRTRDHSKGRFDLKNHRGQNRRWGRPHDSLRRQHGGSWWRCRRRCLQGFLAWIERRGRSRSPLHEAWNRRHRG